MDGYDAAPRLIDIGGRRLAVSVDGSGPTVVLEMGGAGAGVGDAWNGIDRAVADFATVVTYDRAGLGYSDPPPSRPTVADMAEDLGRLLDVLPVARPVVIAGWSLGGLLAEHFAAARPEVVAGLVLIDPTPTDQPEIYAEMPAGMRVAMRLAAAPIMALQGLLARTGLFATKAGRAVLRRMMAAQAGPHLPAAQLEEMVALMAKPVTYQRLRLVTARLMDSCAETQRLVAQRGLPDVPLVVLSAGWRSGGDGMAARMRDAVDQSHARTAALVPRGKRIVIDDASHQLPLERPEAVVDAIRDVVERAGS